MENVVVVLILTLAVLYLGRTLKKVLQRKSNCQTCHQQTDCNKSTL